MISFGTKSRTIRGQSLHGAQCPNCGAGSLTSFGVLNYFHVYWIPTVLSSKTVGVECGHCNKTLLGDEVPSHLSEMIRSDLFTIGRTLPMFSGAILLAMVGLGGIYMVQQDRMREGAYLAQPAVNDYYVADLSKIFTDVDSQYHYGVMRVTSITSTGIEVQIGTIAYNMASGAQHDVREGATAKDSYYGQETFSFEASELQEYWKSGAIYYVDRL